MRPALCVLFLAAISASAAAAQTYPSRKPGLWEMRMTTSGVPPQTISQCIDEATDAKMQKMGQNMSDAKCSKNESKQAGGSYINESICQVAGTTMTSKSVFSGDFGSSYKAEVQSKFNPPLMGRAASETTIEATYKGGCKAGQKPGDIIMPGGMTMNINDLGAMRRPGAK